MQRKVIWVLTYAAVVLGTVAFILAGNKAVTALAEIQPLVRSHCIVIDPGHGGIDGGAISVSGIPESQYNLEISLRLNDFLHLLGYQTTMIRMEDCSVATEGETIAQKKVSDLKERVRMVKRTDHPILLSIHQNFFSQEQYYGAQVFYAKTPGSEGLAEEIQNGFLQTINESSKRKCKKSDGIYIMEQVHCPAVLIECGFLSNWQEESRLRDPEYQKKIVCVISTALHRFLSNT